MKETRFKITPQGREAILRDENDDEALLIVEVVAAAGEKGMTKENCLRICDELVARFGTTLNALEALRKGVVNIEGRTKH